MKNKSVNIIDAIDDDKFLINKSIENAIQIFREDKFVINKLVFDSIELLASAEEAQRELKSKNFMQSFLGVITGANNKLRDKISNNLIQSHYLAELTLKKLILSFGFISNFLKAPFNKSKSSSSQFLLVLSKKSRARQTIFDRLSN